MKNMKYCPYKEAKYALSGTVDKFDAVAILDIDGVVNSIKDLKFQELPINALTVLQESFREINLLTGRYANLFANEGVQKFIECGFDFTKPFRYFAEMGGVEIYLVEEGEIYKSGSKEITSERRRMLGILNNDHDKSVINCSSGKVLYWVAKLHAPEITAEARNLIWQATKFAIAKQIANGSLEKFGIMPNESADLWSERLYNREVENLTKGTVTTSRVPEEYINLAYNVNLEIGDAVANEINKALKDYNDGRATKLEAIHHPDAGCEVLFEGISKFNTTKSIIEQMDARAGHKVSNVATFGDSYTDISMAQASVSLNRYTVHFHLGGYEEFMADFDKEKGLKPDLVAYCPDFNTMFKNNRILASATISAVAMWELIDYLQKSKSSDWKTALNEIPKLDG